MDWRALLHSDPRVAIRVLLGRPGEAELASDGKRFVDSKIAWPGPVYFRKSRMRQHRVAVLSQLISIVDCNAPLVHGLQMAAIDAPNAQLESVLLSLRDDLANGLALWESMANLSAFFPVYFCELVKYGEESGALIQSLRDLQELDALALREWETSRGLVFRYLALLVLMCFSLAIVMTVFVIPMFVDIFNEFGGELPRSAQWLMQMKERLIPHADPLLDVGPMPFLIGLVIVTSLVGVVGLSLLRTGAFRVLSGWVLLSIPGIRTLYRKGNVGHMALVLERLLAVDTPLDVAVETVVDLDVHPAFKRKMERVCQRVREGSTLTDALEQESGWPRSFPGLVSIGERSGLLSETFGKIGRFYNRDCARLTMMLRDSLMPICVLGAASVTLLLELAVFGTVVRVAEVILESL